MNNFMQTLIERKYELLVALGQHLQISLIALLITILIAVPIAIFVSNNKKISEILLQIAGIMQTIPSLALLGLFIPIFGIGTLPSIVVLIIYAIFPILQNTITALNELDPSLKEVATAFGMTRIERLKKFELVLAMPVIISGIRTAAVMIIGTATLAALIGAGGLGSFILLGIDRNNTSLILIGAFSSALLAIIFSSAINFLEKKSLKTIFISFLVTTILIATSFLPFSNMNSKNIIVAGKLGTEQEIIINMYKELIENNTDLKVELKPGFGKTSFLFEALKSRDIDIYPEYTGTILASLLNKKVEFENNKDKVYEIAKKEIYKQDKLILLKPMDFQNTYALALKKEFAEKNNLKNISDLQNIENKIKAGFTLEFNDRKDGNLGLKELYGLNLNVITLEPSLRYQAIESGNVNLIDGYSTDSEIKRYNLVALKDDKNLFPPYQVTPIIREDLLNKYPEVESILNKLSGKISEKEMINMNYEVDVNGKTPYDVAKDYLIKNDLLNKK